MAAAFQAYEGHTYPGVAFTFANGRMVSIIWHSGAYADGGVTTAEIMADFAAIAAQFPGSYEEHDSVLGHCTPDQVLTIMTMVAALPPR